MFNDINVCKNMFHGKYNDSYSMINISIFYTKLIKVEII
jgi:hypothetical protein